MRPLSDRIHDQAKHLLEEGELEMFSLLLSENPQMAYSRFKARWQTGLTLLHLAVIHGQVDIAQWLSQEFPFLVNSPDKVGNTPSHWVGETLFLESSGNLAHKLTKILLDSGASVKARNWARETPLLSMVNRVNDKEGWRLAIRALRENGADLNCADFQGATFLNRLAQEARVFCPVKLWKELVEAGADPSIPNISGQSALDILRQTRHSKEAENLDSVKALLLSRTAGKV